MDNVFSILSRYPVEFQTTRIEPLGNAGGMSGANFWRIAAPHGDFILRRWPPEHPSPDRLQFIHDVLRHSARSVDFLPIPVETRDGQSFVHAANRLWQLEPWMPGTADFERNPSDHRLHAAMTALARFHNAAADFQTRPSRDTTTRVPAQSSIPRRITRLQDLLHDEADELASAIRDAQWPAFAQLARQFLNSLPHALPPAFAQLQCLANVPLPTQPCLRDIWHDHVLFTGDQLTAIVDFGAVDFDTPATDIARLIGSLADVTQLIWEAAREGSESANFWQRALDAYHATRPLSPDETLAVHAIHAANPILAGCNWIRWIYIEKRTFNSDDQILNRFQRIVARLMQ
jgi:homoserine kinase type II